MSKIISTDIEKCTGCKMCELACSFKKTGEMNPHKARINVTSFPEKAYSVPVVCYQCEEAWCARICPTGAITTVVNQAADTRIVKVDEGKCAGCKMCLMACPFGNMGFSEEGHAVKCDMCDGEPECVNFCARGALRVKDISDSVNPKRKAAAEKILTDK